MKVIVSYIVVRSMTNENWFRDETFLVIQWLRLHAPNAGGMGWVPSWGLRSCMPHGMT